MKPFGSPPHLSRSVVRRVATIGVTATLASACTPGASSISAAALPATAATEAQRPLSETVATTAATSHVVIVSIDGLRPDAIGRFNATTIGRLAREGSHTFAATTINPSKTLPSHTSMLTGEGPDEHGITWNSNRTGAHASLPVPTVFGVARKSGLHTAAFFSKGKFNHLEVPGSLDYSQAPNGNGKWSADRTVADVERYLTAHRPNLLFVHLAEPDNAGHLWGWMSTFYGRAVRKADAAVARLMTAADQAYGAENYTIIITADHGGHGRTHGSTRAEDVKIPWIAWGKGVSPRMSIADSVRTMDTAGTALWLLGVDAPDGWSGVAVRSAFTSDAQSASDQAVDDDEASVMF
ncbi:MAG TPA: ectonucleotide pyrophosphatase/phosphodiesterase [Gemmatimonadaceae bacterium]|nr:ectonucleotide pyrophosphatase/phosphodiesterase [Gemmatimonadaceae bacterium]